MTERNPQTLAEVQAGDMVWRFANVAPTHLPVDRVTNTQIIVDGIRYRKYSTQSVDPKWEGDEITGKSSIMVGLLARSRIHSEIIRNLHIPRQTDVTANTIMSIRAMCDAAEVALRELGEWKEPEA